MEQGVGCSGHGCFNATADALAADGYPEIRVSTVGELFTSMAPLDRLQVPLLLNWSVASNSTVGYGNWTATSAACWFYGKGLYDALHVPIGLVGSSWGGTVIESWITNATNEPCLPSEQEEHSTARAQLRQEEVDNITRPLSVMGNSSKETFPNPNGGFGVLYNAMVQPYVTGPMQLGSIVWWQGENNLYTHSNYSCQQKGLVNSWRAAFNTSAFFGFVVLEPWAHKFIMGPPLPLFREAQLETLQLANTGYAQATDIGDPQSPQTGIHPRNKALVGKRLAAAALSVQYGMPAPYKSPAYASAIATVQGLEAEVEISFVDLPTTLVPSPGVSVCPALRFGHACAIVCTILYPHT